ncbi:MAG: hypothetical protein KJO76_10350, partial [Gammaproteobacteria bacterium]|nr:hypothetical protein [Gammaproteobacteria bacterium]
MRAAPPKLLVLDGQGVVFDAPIKRFVRQFATRNGIDFDAAIRRWEGGLREQAWRGLITDAQLWD